MAAYISGVFFATMVISAFVMDLVFNGLGLVPPPNLDVRAQVETFSFNYTFFLNLAFGVLAGWLAYVNHKHPMQHGHSGRDSPASSSDGSSEKSVHPGHIT